ncbi:cytochrome P450 family protein [Phytohabitans suffuscus]|uniref:Cytochrome P450 n=1 Tax=Phytohabitans suffuscus TaxID=624315 RepID=A0A6F8YU93_9ACTN|nr:cytochrome P450 [Phytohabitans suffuscus]BCB89707.1 cytochrome P450 [Phytohabitans suffuscus]
MQKRTPVVIDTTGADIHAENARIREGGPVCPVELPQGVRAWSVTGYEAGRQALSDSRLSKDARQHWKDFVDGRIDPRFPLMSWALMENLITTYGSAHSRLRRLVTKAFTPRRVEAMRPTVDRIVAGLLDDLSGSPPGTVVDLKARYAHPLAAQVIFDLIGVPAGARQTILYGADVQVDTTKTAEEVGAGADQVMREMATLVEAKRRTPANDLTSDLIGAQEEDGTGLGDAEMIGTLLVLLGIGTEPVTNLVTNAVFALLAHPDQRQLISTGQASWQDAIEETLRMEAPVAHLPFRFAVEDVRLGDVTLPAGEPILMNFAAMGRDRAVHGASADSFDITRPDKKHLSFGYGIYSCIGMHLARLETERAVPALFERFPDLALAVPASEIKPQNSFIMNGRRELPVILTAHRQ